MKPLIMFMDKGRSWHSAWAKLPGIVLVFSCFILWICSPVVAQDKQLIQIKTYDQQLQPMKNVEVSINGKDFVSVGNRGTAFVEINENELPIKIIKIKDDELETASWNYSKAVLEIVIRKKNYQLVHIIVKDAANKTLANLPVTFKGKKNITIATDAQGKIEIPLALDEKVNSADQFVINGYEITGLQISDRENILTVNRSIPIRPRQNSAASVDNNVPQKPLAEVEYFKNFDFSKLDSIQSLTVFYAIFKNYQIEDLDDDVKQKVDNKFNELVLQLEDSVQRDDEAFIRRISDSSFVSDDIKNLLNQASAESMTLQTQRGDFDEKIKIINEKLEQGITNLDAETRNTLLADLIVLEELLAQNENRFFKNLSDYRQIINTLKERYFDFQSLENKLSESEAKRLEEQRIFRQRLIGISIVVITFAVLIVLLISFSTRLRKQKRELVHVNAQVNHINENLENIVANRTKLLEEANRELDTFLYRASHDLRSPLCSIIGLCNIALHLSDGEPKELVQKVATTTEGMDKLLKKLSIISEINQPTNYSSITLADVIENVQYKFRNMIEDLKVEFHADCPPDIAFYSYPNLLEVIISNLIENALFYSVMRDPQHARVEFKAAVKDGQLEFSVYDNGIGIEAMIQHRLFDMFFKGHADSKGNGLGLYIVQKSVQALEGIITIQSEPGRYTQFTVKLPLNTVPMDETLEVA